MIVITDFALEKILDFLAEKNQPGLRFRISVQGGGCAGFSYRFDLDDSINEDDFVIDNTQDSVVIDSISLQYLAGSTLDYKEELFGSQFVLNNPNATGHCGCGSSFSI